MLIVRRSARLFHKSINLARRLSTQVVTSPNDEYVEKPEYPEILDLSHKLKKLRQKQKWFDEIQALETIEEKLIKLNIRRYYGYKTVMIGSDKVPYNCLPLIQHYTRTYFEEKAELPDYYKKNDKTVESYISLLEKPIQDALKYAVFTFDHLYGDQEDLEHVQRDRLLGYIISDQINRAIINVLSFDYPHLRELEVDLEPRHEAFWFVGGIDPPKQIKKKKEAVKWQKDYANDPINRAVQYLGKPYLALRHRFPLEPLYPHIDVESEETKSKIPLFNYDARVIGYSTSYRHGTNIPGFWPGSPNEFGTILYQPREHMVIRNPSYGEEDFQEALHAQGIQASFAWQLALACYQGFSTYNDITYPVSVQTILTNGKKWSFYVYQLNTTLVHSTNVLDNPKVNHCWGTKELTLFENIDDQGNIVGFNREVLKYLLHFYINTPVERNIELKPYLGKDVRKAADIEDDKRRQFIERVFKHIASNRPRHREVPEIYMWEKIYKIDNKTRRMEPKRRFFELGINPFRRRLDEHTPVYIPKVVRPGGPKSKNRWEKTYYP